MPQHGTHLVSELQYKGIYELRLFYAFPSSKVQGGSLLVYETKECQNSTKTQTSIKNGETFMFLGSGPVEPDRIIQTDTFPGKYKYIIDEENRNPSKRYVQFLHTTREVVGYFKCDKRDRIFSPVECEDIPSEAQNHPAETVHSEAHLSVC